MAVSHFLAFYAGFTDTELAEERIRLARQLDSFFSSQAVGSKSYSRDSGALKDRMAALGIEQERRRAVAASAGRNPVVGIMRHDVDLGC